MTRVEQRILPTSASPNMKLDEFYSLSLENGNISSSRRLDKGGKREKEKGPFPSLIVIG
jgi:hypothetical protein